MRNVMVSDRLESLVEGFIASMMDRQEEEVELPQTEVESGDQIGEHELPLASETEHDSMVEISSSPTHNQAQGCGAAGHGKPKQPMGLHHVSHPPRGSVSQ